MRSTKRRGETQIVPPPTPSDGEYLFGRRSRASRSRRHRLQSGQSLVEALVASLLVGIAVVAGLGTLNATVIGARQVAAQAWAECMQRGVVEAVTSAPWSNAYPAPASVGIQVSSVTGVPGAQRITVTVNSPLTGGAIARVPPVSVYKAQALSPAGQTYDPSLVAGGCQPFLAAGQ